MDYVISCTMLYYKFLHKLTVTIMFSFNLMLTLARKQMLWIITSIWGLYNANGSEKRVIDGNGKGHFNSYIFAVRFENKV